jgi:uncharacterized protein (TIGR04255 family)
MLSFIFFMQVNRVMSEEITVIPAAGKHAIEVMALAVEWENPLSLELIEALREAYSGSEQLRYLFPELEILKGVTILMGDEAPAFSGTEQSGFQLLKRSEEGGLLWVIHVRPELISCSCFAYERWAITKPEALEVLAPFVEIATAGGAKLRAVGVQYQDAFRISTTEVRAATASLFLTNTPWLTARVWCDDGPWHLHQGWFSAKADNRIAHNLLGVDLTTESEQCVIRINGQHRLLVRTFDSGVPAGISSAEISSALDALHVDNKRILSQLLRQDVCDKIGLTFMEGV